MAVVCLLMRVKLCFLAYVSRLYPSGWLTASALWEVSLGDASQRVKSYVPSVKQSYVRVCFPWGFDPLGGFLAVFIRVRTLLGMSFRVPFDSYSDSGMLHSVFPWTFLEMFPFGSLIVIPTGRCRPAFATANCHSPCARLHC